MNLATDYLGLKLAHPFMPGASPLSADLDSVRRLEDAGASAIVLHSLFEEQIERDREERLGLGDDYEASLGEAAGFLPRSEDFLLGPEEYLEHVRRVKEAVRVPVIASLNGSTYGGWLHHARRIQQAGADALELNLYFLATDPETGSGRIELEAFQMIASLRTGTTFPIAVKLSPFHTAPANFAHELDVVGVNGLVLFNRFYQPDIDPETRDLRRTLELSTSLELPLRLRWLAILSGRVRASLAVTGGVHTAADAAKAILAGAHAVQVVSALLQHGPGHLERLRAGLVEWMERHEIASLDAVRGALNLANCADPGVYERANYMKLLRGFEPGR